MARTHHLHGDSRSNSEIPISLEADSVRPPIGVVRLLRFRARFTWISGFSSPPSTGKNPLGPDEIGESWGAGQTPRSSGVNDDRRRTAAGSRHPDRRRSRDTAERRGRRLQCASAVFPRDRAARDAHLRAGDRAGQGRRGLHPCDAAGDPRHPPRGALHGRALVRAPECEPRHREAQRPAPRSPPARCECPDGRRAAARRHPSRSPRQASRRWRQAAFEREAGPNRPGDAANPRRRESLFLAFRRDPGDVA